MRRSADFTATVRGGRRASGRCVVTHHASLIEGLNPTSPALVGLVVGKSVGNSVVRHRVARRLRAQLAQRLDRLPAGSATVVRALPSSAEASSAEVGIELDRALRSLTRAASAGIR